MTIQAVEADLKMDAHVAISSARLTVLCIRRREDGKVNINKQNTKSAPTIYLYVCSVCMQAIVGTFVVIS